MDDEKLEREAAKIIFSAPAKPDETEVVRAQPQGPEIVFVCPFCNETYPVSEDLAGKAIKCRNCREPSRVDARVLPPSSFSTRTFWLGFAIGAAVTAMAAILLKLAHLY